MNRNFSVLTALFTLLILFQLPIQGQVINSGCLSFDGFDEGQTWGRSTGVEVGDTLFYRENVVAYYSKLALDSAQVVTGDISVISVLRNKLLFVGDGGVKFDFANVPGGFANGVTFELRFGGLLQISVNGAPSVVVRDVNALPQLVAPGVSIAVSQTGVGNFIITLTGEIRTLELGGIEFGIDNFCWKAETSPVACEIGNLIVNPLPCDQDGRYYVTLNFAHVGVGGRGFSVRGGGHNYGAFGYDALPVKIGPFSGLDSLGTELVVQDNANPNCTNFVIFGPWACTDCVIKDFSAQAFPCDQSGNFYINFDMAYENQSDSFGIWFDGTFWGQYAYDDLPVGVGPLASADFPGGIIEGTLTIQDLRNPACQKSTLWKSRVSCNPDSCQTISGLEILGVECDSTNTSYSIQFNVTTSGIDSIAVAIGNQYWATYPVSALPITITNIPLSHGQILPLTVVGGIPTTNPPHPCTLTEYFKVPCRPCAIRNLKATALATPNSLNQYQLVVDFDQRAAVGDRYDLYLNGDLYGNFPLDSLPLSLMLGCDRFGGTVDLRVCIAGSRCCAATTYKPPCQTAPCDISNIAHQVIDCDNSTYDLQLKFTVNNPTHRGYDVWIEGDYVGFFPYTANPLLLNDLRYNGDPEINVKICDGDNPRCCAEYVFRYPCAANPCSITGVKAEQTPCDSLGNYSLLVRGSLTLNLPALDSFKVFVNGTYYGNYSARQIIAGVQVGSFNGNATTTYEVTVQSLRDPDCRKSFVLVVPPCGTHNDCRLSDLIIEKHPCDSNGMFYVDIAFNHANTSDSFYIVGNGRHYGTFAYSSLFITLGPLVGNGATYEFLIVDSENRDCKIAGHVVAPNCNTAGCDIFDVQASVGDCEPDGTFYIKLNFGHRATSDSFYISGVNISSARWKFAYSDLPVRLGPLAGQGQNLGFLILDARHPNCVADFRIVAPNCNPQNCDIFDVQALAGDCEPDGTFYIKLNFGHRATSDSFYVSGANVSSPRWKFAYSDLPIRLGPFPGNGQSMVFLISDAGSRNCVADFRITAPNCNGQNCRIYDILTEVGGCNPDGFFNFSLKFNHQGGTDSFLVYFPGTVNFWKFAYADLPVHIGPLRGNGQTYKFFVADLQNRNCIADFSIVAPDCNPQNCHIYDILTEVSPCTPDGNFYFSLKFNHQGTSDSFYLTGVNSSQRLRFAYHDLPIKLGPFPGNGQTMTFLITDARFGDCRADFRVVAPDCNTHTCRIYDILTEIGDCTPDGNFYFTLKFNHQATGDSFWVYSPGTSLFWKFAYTDLPVRVGPLAGNGQTYKFLVADLGSRNCLEDFSIVAPDCNTQACRIYDIVTHVGDCEPDGTFYFTLKFNHQGSGDSFVLTTNATTPFWRLAYADLPVRLGPFSGNGQRMGFLITDLADRSCRADFGIVAPDCTPRCDISDLTASVGDCDSTGHFSVKLNFDHVNTSDSFYVRGNGVTYGTFAYSDLPVTIGGLNGDGTTIYEFAVVDKANRDCHEAVHIQPVYCGDDCKIYNVHFEVLDCDGDRNFKVALTFSHANTSGNGFLIFADGRPVGPFPANYPQPIILGPFKGDGTTVYDFLIMDMGNPLCYAYEEVGPVNCENCEIGAIITRTTACDNLGQFYVYLDFDHSGTGDKFTVKGNGRIYGTFTYDQLPIKLGPFNGDGQSVYEFVVADVEHPDCGNHTVVHALNCRGNNCVISSVTAAPTPCTPNGIFYVEIKFAHQNTGNQGFTIRGNGHIYGRFQYDQLPIRLGPFAGDGRTVYEFVVYDNQNPNCTNATKVGPINCNTQNCEIVDLVAKPGDCNPDGTYRLTINFVARNAGNRMFDVFTANGAVLSFPLSQLPVTIPHFPRSGNAFDVIKICINDDPNCCASVRFQAPTCAGECVEFEAIPAGKIFRPRNTRIADTVVVESGVTVTLAGLYPSATTVPRLDSVSADSADGRFDAGRGITLTTWNANLKFQLSRIFVAACMEMTFDYFQLGDYNNIAVNGVAVRIFKRFEDLPEDIAPGVKLKVDVFGPGQGRVTLRGKIENFIVGGQRLSLDNFCFEPCQTLSPVWPGDVNLDNFAGHLDMLKVGVAYGKTGQPRDAVSREWAGKDSEDWLDNFNTGTNLKHADCNGDGKVDALDAEVVRENYGQIRGDILTFPTMTDVPNAPPFWIEFPDAKEIETGIPFTGKIHLGSDENPMTNLYGLAFTLRYDPTQMRIVDVKFPAGWVGEPGSDLMTIEKVYENYGLTHIGLTRNNHENVSGKGIVVEFIGIVDIIVGRRTNKIEVDITDVTAINADEFLQPVQTPANIIDFSTSVIETEGGAITLFPNPASERLFIKNESAEEISRVEIMSMDGRILKVVEGYTEVIPISDLPAGVLIIKIETVESTYFDKILKQKE